MNSKDIKNRHIQTDLIRNASYMLKAVACMDDEAMGEISAIIEQMDELVANMEIRASAPKLPLNVEMAKTPSPHLHLIR